MVNKIVPFNDAYIKVYGDQAFEYELKAFLTFKVPGYKFMPAYRFYGWDGNISLYNLRNKQVYAGLANKILDWAQANKWDLECDLDCSAYNFSEHEAKVFVDLLKVPFEPYDYQIRAITDCVRNPRQVVLMPTGSGKSLTIYALTRYFDQRTLIIVPTLNLIEQMRTDFEVYGYGKPVHMIFSGKEKFVDTKVVISTWQSIHNLKADFFSQFNAVIVDEVHLAKAKSLTKILEKLVKCPIRLGFTGSLDGAEVNSLILEGLFGPINKVTTSAALIEQKRLAPLNIKACILKYPDAERRHVKDLNYQEEVAWIVAHSRRNEFIKNLTLSLKGNTLVLFQFVEGHGRPLYELISGATNRPVYFIHGKVPGEDREEIRKIVNQCQDAIIIGSNQTVSTGINIPTLKNVVFTSPTKSRIRTLQSIGRVLRTAEDKDGATLIDIVDDLSSGKKKNHALIHFFERLKIYSSEQFPFKTYNIKI